MSIRSLLTGPKARTRIVLVGVGVILLVLTINQVMWQRWGFAVTQGTLGLSLLLAGVLSSDATLMNKAITDLLKISLWSVLLIAGVVAAAVTSELIGLSIPYITALWLLAVGARFAQRRMSVIAISVIASLLFLLQCGIFAVGILLSPYHFEHRTQFQLLLAVVIITGVALVFWFVYAKRPHTRASA
ncbi:MAG: hypothetical protein OEW21_13425 [Betaproteobacteria bacterium]|nr:hypothetical protein [Betaproteobacteria bacterium]